MMTSDRRRAVAAARGIVSELGLAADEAVVLSDSNTLMLRLLPGDVVARVAPRGEDARLQVAVAERLAEVGSPAGTLDRRVAPRVHERDGFEVTLWTYYEPVSSEHDPAVFAAALVDLHAALRRYDGPAPHFTDRVASARELVADPQRTPGQTDADRALLVATLDQRRRAITERGAPEQLLHGEPHPGNVLGTSDGLRFIDLQTCCRGPVAFDLAHVPEAVSQRYPGADRELLADCRVLVLAMVAAWRWDPDDQLPDGRRKGRELVDALRAGPPWPTLDDLMR